MVTAVGDDVPQAEIPKATNTQAAARDRVRRRLGPIMGWNLVSGHLVVLDSDPQHHTASVCGTIRTDMTSIQGGNVGHGQAAIDIDASADDVWAVIGDFGGIGDWMPGIESCRVEGDDRILETMGMEITERLVSKDDAGRVLTYSITKGAPVESHQAVITVSPTGSDLARDLGHRRDSG